MDTFLNAKTVLEAEVSLCVECLEDVTGRRHVRECPRCSCKLCSGECAQEHVTACEGLVQS